MKGILLESTEFKVVLNNREYRYKSSDYDLLQMAFYPGKDGASDRTALAQIRLYIDGHLCAICEQRRNLRGDYILFETDVELAAYFFTLQNWEEDDFEELRQEFAEAKICDVKIELYQIDK